MGSSHDSHRHDSQALGSCLRCSICGRGLIVARPCNRTHDTVCSACPAHTSFAPTQTFHHYEWTQPCTSNEPLAEGSQCTVSFQNITTDVVISVRVVMPDYSASNEFIEGIFVGEGSGVRLGGPTSTSRYLHQCTDSTVRSTARTTSVPCPDTTVTCVVITGMELPVKAVSVSNILRVRITASPVSPVRLISCHALLATPPRRSLEVKLCASVRAKTLLPHLATSQPRSVGIYIKHSSGSLHPCACQLLVLCCRFKTSFSDTASTQGEASLTHYYTHVHHIHQAVGSDSCNGHNGHTLLAYVSVARAHGVWVVNETGAQIYDEQNHLCAWDCMDGFEKNINGSACVRPAPVSRDCSNSLPYGARWTASSSLLANGRSCLCTRVYSCVIAAGHASP